MSNLIGNISISNQYLTDAQRIIFSPATARQKYELLAEQFGGKTAGRIISILYASTLDISTDLKQKIKFPKSIGVTQQEMEDGLDVKIIRELGNKVMVRGSCDCEDGFYENHAGVGVSRTIGTTNLNKLEKIIKTVFNKNKDIFKYEFPSPKSNLLIDEYVGTPYIVIAYSSSPRSKRRTDLTVMIAEGEKALQGSDDPHLFYSVHEEGLTILRYKKPFLREIGEPILTDKGSSLYESLQFLTDYTESHLMDFKPKSKKESKEYCLYKDTLDFIQAVMGFLLLKDSKNYTSYLFDLIEEKQNKSGKQGKRLAFSFNPVSTLVNHYLPGWPEHSSGGPDVSLWGGLEALKNLVQSTGDDDFYSKEPTVKEVREMTLITKAYEKTLGFPVDIEFGKSEHYYLYQLRPILPRYQNVARFEIPSDLIPLVTSISVNDNFYYKGQLNTTPLGLRPPKKQGRAILISPMVQTDQRIARFVLDPTDEIILKYSRGDSSSKAIYVGDFPERITAPGNDHGAPAQELETADSYKMRIPFLYSFVRAFGDRIKEKEQREYYQLPFDLELLADNRIGTISVSKEGYKILKERVHKKLGVILSGSAHT